MGKNNRPMVAQIRTNFNLFRNPHEAKTGPVTEEEEITAMERFVNWHKRQVEVGEQMLAHIRSGRAHKEAAIHRPARTMSEVNEELVSQEKA